MLPLNMVRFEIHKILLGFRLGKSQRLTDGGEKILGMGNKIPPLFPCVQIALCHQLIVGGFHGNDTDVQIFRQLSFRGQFLSGGQFSADDVVFNMAIQLLVQAAFVLRGQGIGEHGIPSKLVI